MRNLFRVLGVVTLVASFGLWVYAYSGRADRPTPDLLDDATWSQSAETICAQALAEADAIPGAQDAEDPTERSRQVVETTEVFEQMVDGLATLEPGSDRDAQITDDWLSDWRTLLGDRLRYAEAVLDDPAAPFTVTDTGANERLDKRITRFANTNSMPSCVTPTDV